MITNKALNVNGKTQNTAFLFYVYRQKCEDFAQIICDLGLYLAWEIIEKSAKYFVYKLVVDGYGGSQKAKALFADLELRFQLLNDDIFGDFKQVFTSEQSQISARKLGRILPSLPCQKTFFTEKNEKGTSVCISVGDKLCEIAGDDPYFWAMKAKMENDFLGKIQDFHPLWDWAVKKFPYKDQSTLKSKARSIFKWYSVSFQRKKYERKLTDKEYQMTRSENMKRVKANQKSDTRNKIKGVLDDDVLFNEYKHTEGRWAGCVNVEKLAKRLNMRNETIRSHLKEMGLR